MNRFHLENVLTPLFAGCNGFSFLGKIRVIAGENNDLADLIEHGGLNLRFIVLRSSLQLELGIVHGEEKTALKANVFHHHQSSTPALFS